jgi:hypothetical protein
MAIEMEYPIGVKNDAHIKVIAREYKFPKTDNSDSSIVRGKILGKSYFYIPAGLVQGTSSTWTPEDMGVIGNIVDEEYARALTEAGIVLADQLAPGATLHTKKTLGALKGKLLSPNDVLVLSSVNRYSMVISLQLAPQTPEEGTQVKKIIETYRKWSQPSLKLDEGKVMMNYPPVFDIIIRSKGMSLSAASSDELDNNNLFFYRDMVIDSFDINYQGGTNESLFYRDGAPVLSLLRVTFKSLKPGFNVDQSLIGN